MDDKLKNIIDECWDHYIKNKDIIIKGKNNDYHNLIPNPSIPILWFGDLEKYLNSDMRVVTVALNPSNMEFKKDINSQYSFYRFNGSEEIYKNDKLDDNEKKNYVSILNNYFKGRQYSWFNNFKIPLESVSSSYYDNKENVAIHTDIYTPLATDPTWGKIDSAQIKKRLSEQGLLLWKELVEYLQPDIILVSISKKSFEELFDLDPKKPILEKTYDCNNKAYIRMYMKGNTIIIWGLNYRGQPFCGMSHDFIRSTINEMLKK